MKEICTIHRFYYSGRECPLCAQERFRKLSHRFPIQEKTESKPNRDREITNDDLNRLVNKFSNR